MGDVCSGCGCRSALGAKAGETSTACYCCGLLPPYKTSRNHCWLSFGAFQSPCAKQEAQAGCRTR